MINKPQHTMQERQEWADSHWERVERREEAERLSNHISRAEDKLMSNTEPSQDQDNRQPALAGDAGSVIRWQPIGSAPKDGSKILLYNGYDFAACAWGEVNVCGRKAWVYGPMQDDYNSREEFDSPTHWLGVSTPNT